MNIFTENTQISSENEVQKNKRSYPETELEEINTKKSKLVEANEESTVVVTTDQNAQKISAQVSKTQAPQSPKKRLELSQKDAISNPLGNKSNKQQKCNKFIYGNYNQYYGYRNKEKDFHDIRLDVFAAHEQLLHDKQVLDIGCNSGFLTMEIAKRFAVKTITGLDIDRSLINQAQKQLLQQKKAQQMDNDASKEKRYPFNVSFVCANYVLRDDVLLELEREQFDVIFCLSITKWIQLNFGDAGLKQTFRRMFLQLRTGGKLILEAQSYTNYGRRKKMTETIFSNYKAMEFYPQQFTDYLLSSEVGFKSVELLGVPEHCAAGFKRPIQVFTKS